MILQVAAIPLCGGFIVTRSGRPRRAFYANLVGVRLRSWCDERDGRDRGHGRDRRHDHRYGALLGVAVNPYAGFRLRGFGAESTLVIIQA